MGINNASVLWDAVSLMPAASADLRPQTTQQSDHVSRYIRIFPYILRQCTCLVLMGKPTSCNSRTSSLADES